uniref:FCP1-like phosphatase C-terminal domain-containing protein n=1 Tax=Maylandia zebra TaxID=106582 RepID=A0A3P9AUA5_9CICH
MSGKASLGTSQSQQDEGVESGQDDEQPGPSRRKRQPSMSETMPLYTLCKEDLDSMDKEVRTDETFVQHSTWWHNNVSLFCSYRAYMVSLLAGSSAQSMEKTPILSKNLSCLAVFHFFFGHFSLFGQGEGSICHQTRRQPHVTMTVFASSPYVH